MLSIVVLTRNRKIELLKALRSCIECTAPEKMEFIIIDNASHDDTREAVKQFFIENDKYVCNYHYISENIGVAGGRNEGFKMAHGRYVYFLDDDAYLEKTNPLFFNELIKIFEENNDVICVTTLIFDTAINDFRDAKKSKKDNFDGNYKKILMFCGGSFILDKQRLIDKNKIFLEHQIWGMEELYPSLKWYFSGFCVVQTENLCVVHNPSLNTRFGKKREIILYYTGSVHYKFIFYPPITYPLLYSMFILRIIKHIGFTGLFEAVSQLKHINHNMEKETISFSMLWRLFTEFGFTATF
ncbi:MAG: glycosyltransferase [Chloroflexi bacterium]|nr:glycosyltransferase [Chloroflexota bacterium]